MSKRSDTIESWRERTRPPREPATRQPTRPEDWHGGTESGLVVLRSLDVAGKNMTAQRVRETDDPLTVDELAAGVEAHVEAFGPVFKVKPILSTPYSFMDIKGLVVPVPADPDNEELGANFVPLKLSAGRSVEVVFKIPGAAFSDDNAQSSEGSSV